MNRSHRSYDERREYDAMWGDEDARELVELDRYELTVLGAIAAERDDGRHGPDDMDDGAPSVTRWMRETESERGL